MSLSSIFPRIAIAALDGTARSPRYRQAQFHQLHKKLVSAKLELIAACQDDYGYSDFDATFEYSAALAELRHHYDNINLEAEVAAARSIEVGIDNTRRSVGVGIVYIVPIPHTMLYSVVSALCGAIAAGNCVILEMPQTTMRTPQLLRSLLEDALSSDIFAIAKTRPSTEALKTCIVVAQTWQESLPGPHQHLLSPTDLRNVAVVDRTADVELAAKSLASLRFSFGGASAHAPDMVLVHEAVYGSFSRHLLQSVSELFEADTVAARQRSALKSKHATRKVGEENSKTDGLTKIASTSHGEVLEVADRDHPIFKLKIRTPTMVINTFTSLDDAIDFANTSESLGILLAFAAPAEANYVSNFTNMLSTCVNNVPPELLLGPLTPLHFPLSLSPRYPVTMFQTPRPQLVLPSPMSKKINLLSTVRRRGLQDWVESVQADLTPTGQAEGHKIDFFLQGMMISTAVSGIAIMACVAVIVKFGVKAYWARPSK